MYRVLTAGSVIELEAIVRQWIEEGYVLAGGIAVCNVQGYTKYYQAICR
jgi:hypothetical protein